MRPRTIHQVYTISNSICHGGHFYLLSNLDEALRSRLQERDVLPCPTNQCLPFGHAAMIWFAVLLTSPDFQPEKYHMSTCFHCLTRLEYPSIPCSVPAVFEACKKLLKDTAKRMILNALPEAYVSREATNIVHVLRWSGWLTAYVLDRL